MPRIPPPIAICTYRVKRGKESLFLKLLRRHWPLLRRLGLAGSTPSQIFRGRDESKKTFYVEILPWKDSRASDRAHETPEVMALWEPMGMLVEDRLGRPGMEFPHVERIPNRKGRKKKG